MNWYHKSIEFKKDDFSGPVQSSPSPSPPQLLPFTQNNIFENQNQKNENISAEPKYTDEQWAAWDWDQRQKQLEEFQEFLIFQKKI